MKRTALLTLAMTLLLAGCAGPAATVVTTEPEPSASTTGTSTPTPSGPPRAMAYGSVVELRDAAVATGYECPSWDQHNSVTLAIESAQCSDADVFSIYNRASDLAQVVSGLESLGVGSHLLVGPNWIINAAEEHLDLLHNGLGGEIRITEESEKPTETPEPEPIELSTDDFKVGIKILKKRCFGSAGCNVTFRIVPKYTGTSPLPDTGTIEVTYEVKGGEDPLINTFTIEDGTASYASEESIGTPKSSSKLKAKVTDVTHNDW